VPGYQIVDARAAVFYDGVQAGGSTAEPHPKGHIVSAGNVPFTTITGADFKLKPASELAAAFKAAGADPGEKLIVYCHVGWQGTVVVFAARSLGMDAVLYDGSFQDWSARKLPVETAAQ
jgi:thiosulfate/3-mercaptopyruvate sulfurtransferase